LDVSLLYDSQSKREHKLTNNLLTEDSTTLNWIGLDYKIISCQKGLTLKSKPGNFILRKVQLESGQEFTCAYQSGRILWLGDSFGTIYKVDYYNGNVVKKILSPGSAIQNIVSDNAKNLFISISKKGIFEYDDRTGEFMKVIPILGNDVVTNSYFDSYDKLWFEINQTSLVYYDPFNKQVKRFNFSAGNVNKTLKYQDGKEQGMFFLTTGFYRNNRH